MRFRVRDSRRVGVLAALVSVAGLVGAAGSMSPAGAATTFKSVQCHGSINGTPLPDSAITPMDVTVDVVAPSLVATGSQFTVTIKGRTATLPATQGSFTINSFTNLSTTFRIDGATFASGSAAASGSATIDGTPIVGSLTLTSNTIKTATAGPIHPGTLVTPDITVKVTAGAVGTAITMHAVELTTTANLTVGTAPLDCPLPNRAVTTTNVAASCAAHDGYWLVGRDGGLFPFGAAQFYGSTGGRHLREPVVGMASAAAGAGYWFAASDGGVFAFGPAATFYGSMGGTHLDRPVVAMTATPSGKGYWLTGSDGGVFSFGDAQFYGSMGGRHLDHAVVAMTATPSGKGYWLTGSDGGVFSFGDANFYGSMGGRHLDHAVVAMTATPSGKGYWLAAGGGGVFGFGDASFFGSVGSRGLTGPAVGVHNTITGGYRVAGADGNVYAFNAPNCGSLAGQHLAAPIAAIEAVDQRA